MKIRTFYPYIAGLLVIGFLMSACNKFVNKEPISQISAGRYWQTESDVKSGVAAIYDALQGALNRNFWEWGECRGDNFLPKNNMTEMLDLTDNTITPDQGFCDWTGLYRVITRANLAITNIPGIDFDEETKNNYLGQAYALRALAYFYGVRVWGDMPIVTKPYTSLSQDFDIKRSPADSVMQTIILPDLKQAESLLSPNMSSVYEISPGGLYAIETDVYMWMHDYADAETTSAKIMNMNYSLVPTQEWGTIFTKDDQPSTESIFTLHWVYAEDGTNSLNSMLSYGAAWARPSPDFVNAFEPGDYRAYQTFDTTDQTPGQSWKYTGVGNHDAPTDVSENDYPIYRLSGILLLRAEALNQLDRTQEAVDLLNQIRERALLPDRAISDFPTKDSLEDAILHERRVEMYGEGKRWFDLVRSGRAIKVMQPINGLDDPRLFLYPVYYQNLIDNLNLSQTPGY